MWTSECGPCSAYRTLIFVQALNVISFKLLSDFVDASVEEQVCVDAQLDHPTAQIHIHAGARRETLPRTPTRAYYHTLPQRAPEGVRLFYTWIAVSCAAMILLSLRSIVFMNNLVRAETRDWLCMCCHALCLRLGCRGECHAFKDREKTRSVVLNV